MLWIIVSLAIVTTIASEQVFVEKAENDAKVLMCYYGAWAWWRVPVAVAQFGASNIDPFLCTHVIYSFAGMHNSSTPYPNRIFTMDPYLDLRQGETEAYPEPGNPGNNVGGLGMLYNTVQLRDGASGNRNLKVLIAIGGWNQESERYSDMARHRSNRTIFIQSIVGFIRNYNLDGVDMDWEYPTQRGGLAEDRSNFVFFLQELREELNVAGTEMRRYLLLTSAFGCGKDVIDAAYDVPEIAKHIDYFNLMTYDFKVASDNAPIGHQSPLYSKAAETEKDRQLTTQWAVDYFIQLGAPVEKVVLGVGAYGRSFTMTSPGKHNFYDISVGPGIAGASTQEPGFLSYYEVCSSILSNHNKWTLAFDHEYQIPYAYDDTTWIGYDDEISAQEKVDFAISRRLAGVMVWSIDMDDFRNSCGGWVNLPIVRALKDRLEFHSTSAIGNSGSSK